MKMVNSAEAGVIQLKVGPEEIEDGSKACPFTCPAGLAAQGSMPEGLIASIGRKRARIYERAEAGADLQSAGECDCGCGTWFRLEEVAAGELPEHVTRWIKAYDGGEKVGPFEAEIRYCAAA